MMELYEWPPVRSQRAKWVLEELGIDYNSHLVDLSKGQQNSAEYRAIHPLGVLPALKSDNYTIYESTAIVMQLIDEHPAKGLAPEPGTSQRAYYYQWCAFAGAELDPCVMMYFDNTLRPLEAMRPPGTPHSPDLANRGRADFETRAQVLSNTLAKQDYMLGTAFSGADILIGHSIFMAKHIGLMGKHPILEAYYDRLKLRPAHQRVYES